MLSFWVPVSTSRVLGGDYSRWLVSIERVAKFGILNLTAECSFHGAYMRYFAKGDPLDPRLPKSAEQVLRKTLVYLSSRCLEDKYSNTLKF